jgi:DNA-binding winged helix-turn-helix (wHTH) protein
MQPEAIIRFCNYQFDCYQNNLSLNGQNIPLQHKPAQLLALLLSTPGELVSREDIIHSLWGKQVVDFDQNINFCIKCIRKALDDDPRQSKFVQTVPRKGYRFIAPIDQAPKAKSQTQYWKHLVWAALVLIPLYFKYFYDEQQPETSVSALVDHNEQDLKRAQYLLDKGDYQSIALSMPIFKTVIAGAPQSAEAYGGLAIATLLASPGYEQQLAAVELAQQAINKDAKSAYSNLAMGMVEFYLNWNIVAAQSYFEEATLLAPLMIKPWHELSVVQTIRHDYTAAEQSINQALNIDPGRVQELYHTGWFYLASGNQDMALQQCLKSLEIAPEHPYSHLCAADAALALGLAQSAQKHLITYMELLQVEAATISDIKHRLEEGKISAFYQWRLDYLTNNGADNFQLALVHAQLMQNTEALSSLQQAIENHNLMLPTAWAFSEFSQLRESEKFVELMAPVKK